MDMKATLRAIWIPSLVLLIIAGLWLYLDSDGHPSGASDEVTSTPTAAVAPAVKPPPAATVAPMPKPSAGATLMPPQPPPATPGLFEKAVRWLCLALGAGSLAWIISVCGKSKHVALRALAAHLRQFFPGTKAVADELDNAPNAEVGKEVIGREIALANQIMATPRYERPAHVVTTWSRVTLLGPSESGKTSLISHWLSYCGPHGQGPDPRARTGATCHYARVQGWQRPGTLNVWKLDLDDYRGQRPDDYMKQLSSEHDVRRALAEKHGQQAKQMPDYPHPITAAVFICDLFSTTPGPNGEPDTALRPSLDSSHIGQFTGYWTKEKWEDWRKALGDDVQYMCIFVNKVDLLRSYRSTQRKRVEELLEDVRETLRPRDGVLNVIHGSALTGQGVPNLLKELATHAVPWVM